VCEPRHDRVPGLGYNVGQVSVLLPPAAPWMLELGAVLMRSETELMLKSRRVVPGRLLDAGFAFRHSSWPEAARSLCAAWRLAR
jgi:NAD dependent epimerase/dehydratase family enzyme